MKKLLTLLTLLVAALTGAVLLSKLCDPETPSFKEVRNELPYAAFNALQPRTWIPGLVAAYRAAKLMKSWHQHPR